MQKKETLILALICISLFVQPVFAAEENGTSSSNFSETADIVVLRQLIELDFTQKEQITAHESIVFVKNAQENYTGHLPIWVPEGAKVTEISRKEMSGGEQPTAVSHDHEGILFLINDTERFNARTMPPIYSLKYTVQVTGEEKTEYAKFLTAEPYNYPISSLIIEVTAPEGVNPVVTDEHGHEISGEIIEDNRFVYAISNPQFKEIRVKAESEDGGPIKSSYLLIIPLILIATYLILNRVKKPEDDKKQLKEMKMRHEAIFAVMKDMERDLREGTISKDDYNYISNKYKTEADELVKKMDKIKEKK